MLGVPSHPGAVGAAALVLGILAVALAVLWKRSLLPVDLGERLAVAAVLVVAAGAPYLVWRVVSDLRTTTAMTPYDRSVAGPVQAYLQPYLLDPVREIIGPRDTYATVVGPGVTYNAARQAFPSLALQTLFPRSSTVPSRADWIVAWGAQPSSVAKVGRVIVARAAAGPYPALLVARVRR
jgi:hypothetical protein